MSEMLTLTVIVATVSVYAGNVVGLLSSLPVPVWVAIIGLVVAALILVGALVYFRGSGKKKATNAAAASGTTDWQRQAQAQPGAPGTMNAWNSQGMPADNAWAQPGQQQANAWGAQAPSPQQPGGWDAQQQANPWATQNAAQQPQGWGTQVPAAQQQQQTAWGGQNAGQSPSGWGTQTPAPQQQGGWNAQNPAQQQQQQPAWGAQGFGQQPGTWGNSGAPLAGMEAGRNAQAWDQTALPSSQDAWAQQQSAPAWGTSGNAAAQQMPGQQQNNSSAFGSGSGQSWGQAAQSADPWAQPQPVPPAQQAQQGGQGGWPQAYQQPVPASPQNQPGSPAVPSWQQQGPGVGQAQPGFGTPGQAGFGSPNPFGVEEADRTMLRNTGAQTQNCTGIVRIEEGKEPGRVYEIRKESLSIGRSRESDVFLEDLAVSRLHASIINMGNGNYALRDEGSANGTKVNGQTVNKYQPFTLSEGDKIQLGQTVLVFAKR